MSIFLINLTKYNILIIGDGMNNKGFTLLEIILVVAILGVITLIVVPSVSSILNKNKNDQYENLKKSIISAAKMYVSDNRYDLGITCNNASERPTFTITLKDIVDSGDLTEPVVDPRDKSEISSSNVVNITYNCSNKSFNYEYNYE